MAISPKMLAIIEKVDAADAAYSAGLLATAKEEAVKAIQRNWRTSAWSEKSERARPRQGNL